MSLRRLVSCFAMKVFFDASVIIAALLSPKGGSALLLQFIKSGEIIGITSQTVLEEMLTEEKFVKFKKTKKEIEKFIAKSGILIREYITLEQIAQYKDEIDPEDAHLIAGANSTKCEFLVSLDKKHLLKNDIQKKFLPLRIVSPKELLEEIVG